MVDVASLPPVSAADADLLTSLQSDADNGIDTSDLPELTESFWTTASRNPFFRPTKTSTTIRVDSDVLAWFKAQGKGYQSRMNAALRRAMLSSSDR